MRITLFSLHSIMFHFCDCFSALDAFTRFHSSVARCRCVSFTDALDEGKGTSDRRRMARTWLRDYFIVYVLCLLSSDKYLFWKSSIMSAVTCDVILLLRPIFIAMPFCSLLLGDKRQSKHTHSHCVGARSKKLARFRGWKSIFACDLSPKRAAEKQRGKLLRWQFFSPDSNIHKLHNMFVKDLFGISQQFIGWGSFSVAWRKLAVVFNPFSPPLRTLTRLSN